jgi:hypothetical protein
LRFGESFYAAIICKRENAAIKIVLKRNFIKGIAVKLWREKQCC